MTTVGPFILNLPREEAARDAGIAKASTVDRKPLLELAQDVATRIAQQRGTVDADSVWQRLIELGFKPADLGNSIGGLFRNAKKWTCVGTKQSARAGRHGSMIRVWRLTNGNV